MQSAWERCYPCSIKAAIRLEDRETAALVARAVEPARTTVHFRGQAPARLLGEEASLRNATAEARAYFQAGDQGHPRKSATARRSP